MNITSMKAAALALATAILLLSAAPKALATDLKTFAGSACTPYGANTTWAELAYRPSGITNSGTSNEYILCGLNTDIETTGIGDPIDQSSIVLDFKAGTSGASISCTATMGSSLQYGANTQTLSLTLTANTIGTIRFDGVVHLNVAQPLNVNCRLPPKATLLRMYLIEQMHTQT